MLDLRSAGSEVRVATLDLALPESLPGVYGFPKAEFMDEFRARIEERRPLPCLVIDDRSGIVRWFSPGLGLVREDVHGRVRELVYAQP
jgi:hypothetical protein